MQETAQSISVSAESNVASRAFWSMLDAAANPIAALLMLAGLLRALSATDYGLLVVAMAAPGLALAINPAIAATTTRFVSSANARPTSGSRSIAGVITSSLIVVITVDLVLILAVIAVKNHLSAWVFGSQAGSGRGNLLVLATMALGIQQVDAVLGAAIRGLERFRSQALLEVAMRMTLAGAVVAIASRTGSVQAVLLAQCAVCGVWLVARGVALRSMLASRRLLHLQRPSQFAPLLRYGGWMWLTAIAAAAYVNVDRILLGRVLGPAVAGQYNVYVQLTQLIHFVPSSLFAFSFPAFSRLGGALANGELRVIYRNYFAGICITALLVAAVLILSWPFVLPALAGPALDHQRNAVPWLLTANYLLLALSIAPYYLLLALGRPRLVSVVTSGSMLASIAIMAVLVSPYGMAGVALGRLFYGLGALALVADAHRRLAPVRG